MREKFHCRRCEKISRGLKPFAVLGAKPHYAPDLPVKLEKLHLEAVVDPKKKTLKGVVKQTIRVIQPELTRISLDQVDLNIEEVLFGKQRAEFSVQGQKLFITLPKTMAHSKVGSEHEFSVRYHLHDPKRGLYFTSPDDAYPSKRYQVWSQGQDEDTRYWIPTFDYPNQKALTEVQVKVPKGFTAISNGALVSKKDSADQTEFHYRLGVPHVTYLITLVVGEFAEWADTSQNGLPVQYFVSPGREEDGKRAFSNTPEMIRVFSEKIGVPYPYEKYSQVAVQDFIFGGMENTSSTTQTDRTLHDERAHLDFSSDPLVSHELAHQWFGDLLTCRDWSHGWLNEGFATFMERVWIENNIKDYGSPVQASDEAKYYGYADLKEYQEEDATRYRRPIVCNTYLEPINLFDCHLYQKGGLVLNLIRSVLGPELFWKSVQTYVTRHRGQNVETLDLIRAIEDTTGRNLRRLFDEWIFQAGYPEFELTYQFHDGEGDKKRVELVIEQKQTQGKQEIIHGTVVTPLFHLNVSVLITFSDGRKITQTVDASEAKTRIFFISWECYPQSKAVSTPFTPPDH